MRRFLDGLYACAGALAALFLLAIALIVLAQVTLNMIDSAAKWLSGEPIGLVIESYAEHTGFFLAASSFLALAYAFRHGSHIRVSLVIQRFTGERRRRIELWCVFLAGCFSAYFAYYMIALTWQSYKFNDLSVGMDPVKLWIPQSSLALGLLVLTIALIDEYVSILRGARPSYARAEEVLVE